MNIDTPGSREVGHLRKSAGQMIADLNRLRQDISAISGQPIEEFFEQSAKSIRHELMALRDRVNSMRSRLGQTTAHVSAAVQTDVRQRPLMYAAALFGIGALVTAVAVSRSRRTLH